MNALTTTITVEFVFALLDSLGVLSNANVFRFPVAATFMTLVDIASLFSLELLGAH